MDTTPPLGRHYTVHGRRLALHRAGTGGPAVVVLPGAGLTGLDYLPLQQDAAELTTAVFYDRGGTGWSDPVPLPRTPHEVVAELRDVLREAAVPSPRVLVGHSLGAFYARRYGQLFPDEVAGLLLLDPGHEDLLDYLPPEAATLNAQLKPDLDALPELTAEQVRLATDQYRQLYAAWPEDVRDTLIDHHLSTWRVGVQETTNFETAVYDELRAGGPLPDVPLIVVTAAGQNPAWAQVATEAQMAAALAGVRAAQATLAASVRRGEQRVLTDVSHQYLHIQHPEAIRSALHDLLERVKEGGSRVG